MWNIILWFELLINRKSQSHIIQYIFDINKLIWMAQVWNIIIFLRDSCPLGFYLNNSHTNLMDTFNQIKQLIKKGMVI